MTKDKLWYNQAMSKRSEKYSAAILFRNVPCRFSEVASCVPGFIRKVKTPILCVESTTCDPDHPEERINLLLMMGRVRRLLNQEQVERIRKTPPIVDIFCYKARPR